MRKLTKTGTIQDLEFIYDATGNRIIKIVKPRTGGGATGDQKDWVYTYYVRDAHGNVMATYKRTFVNTSGNNYNDNLDIKEFDIYGSSRNGLRNGSDITTQVGTFTATISSNNFTGVSYTSSPTVPTCTTTPCIYSREQTHKVYELANHLGNVLVTVTDKRIPYTPSGSVVTYYKSDPISYTDYYAFGSPMPGRIYNPTSYRYGFNGKENDGETVGTGEGTQDYGMRIYNPALGRFLSG